MCTSLVNLQNLYKLDPSSYDKYDWEWPWEWVHEILTLPLSHGTPITSIYT
jgi:hypothetical protein